MRALLLSVVLLLLTPFVVAPGINAQENSPPPPKAATAPQSNADEQEIEALKSDLQKMRSLLSQMQTNLAFVGSTTTPLNHQLELEIQMWRVLIDQTERHLQKLERTKETK
jgi:hypothetical protein